CTGIADVSDQLTAFNALTLTDSKVVHMSISRAISKAVIDLQHLAITGELHFHFINDAIRGSVDWRADRRGKINTIVHLFHLVDRVEAESITRSESDKLFIGDGLNGGNS